MHTRAILAAAPQNDVLRESMHAKARELRQGGADDRTVATKQAEIVLAFQLEVGTLLPPLQRRIALEQHECRTFRDAAEACDTLTNGGQPCHDNCPIARMRAENIVKETRAAHAFATEWAMEEIQ